MENIVFKRIYFFSIIKICQYSSILTECGKELFDNFGLLHWHNSFFKNLIIVLFGLLNNQQFIGFLNNKACCAYQIKTYKTDGLLFSKLCTRPCFYSHGIGTMCLSLIEKKCLELNRLRLVCDVYDKNINAIHFYEKRGFKIVGTKETRKYSELVMEKKIQK